jgi:hypothetical protein
MTPSGPGFPLNSLNGDFNGEGGASFGVAGNEAGRWSASWAVGRLQSRNRATPDGRSFSKRRWDHMKMARRIRLPRLAVAVLGCVVASSVMLQADGTRRLTVNSLQFNPCNGETATGQVDALLLVQVNEQTGQVKVHRSFHGTVYGNQGNTYQVSSIANDFFDAPQPFYDLRFHNNVSGLGGAPNFEVEGDLRLYVDANQNPIGYAASGNTFTCKQ